MRSLCHGRRPSHCLYLSFVTGVIGDFALDEALVPAKNSVQLDPEDAYAQGIRGCVHWLKRDAESAIREYKIGGRIGIECRGALSARTS